MNYILFDSDYIPYDMGFDQINKNALENGSDVDHDLMSLEAVATKPGYIYIYLSNESDKIVDVYFDDLLITHKYSPIVAGADYYPFGLVMEGREVTQEDWRYGYQGAFAEQDEETGYGAFELRMYDARFGRWTSTDPYGQFWSPYVGMGNAPHMSVDPDGGWVIDLAEVVITGTRHAALKAAAASVMSNVFSSIARGSGGGCCPGSCCPEFRIQGGEISEYDPRLDEPNDISEPLNPIAPDLGGSLTNSGGSRVSSVSSPRKNHSWDILPSELSSNPAVRKLQIGLIQAGLMPGVGNISSIGSQGVVKGTQWLAKMSTKYPNAQVAFQQIGNYWKYTVNVPGRVSGSTVYTKYLNSQGKTIKFFHDTYSNTGKFLHRGWTEGSTRIHQWWDGVVQTIGPYIPR